MWIFGEEDRAVSEKVGNVMAEHLYSVREVATLLGLSRWKVYQLLNHERILRGVQIAGSVRIKGSEVARLIAEGEQAHMGQHSGEAKHD